jgi:hypothetical protein
MKKTPKRRKVWVTGHFDKGIKLAVSKAEALKFNPQQQPVRLVELRKGEVIVDVEKAAVMAANWAYDFPDRWDSAVRKFHNEVRAALRKVGKR